jgi:hypothetical protein
MTLDYSGTLWKKTIELKTVLPKTFRFEVEKKENNWKDSQILTSNTYRFLTKEENAQIKFDISKLDNFLHKLLIKIPSQLPQVPKNINNILLIKHPISKGDVIPKLKQVLGHIQKIEHQEKIFSTKLSTKKLYSKNTHFGWYKYEMFTRSDWVINDYFERWERISLKILVNIEEINNFLRKNYDIKDFQSMNNLKEHEFKYYPVYLICFNNSLRNILFEDNKIDFKKSYSEFKDLYYTEPTVFEEIEEEILLWNSQKNDFEGALKSSIKQGKISLAIQLLQNVSDPIQLSEAHSLIGEYYIKNNNTKQALYHYSETKEYPIIVDLLLKENSSAAYEKAIKIADSHQLNDTLKEAQMKYATFLEQNSQIELAGNYYELAHQYKSSLEIFIKLFATNGIVDSKYEVFLEKIHLAQEKSNYWKKLGQMICQRVQELYNKQKTLDIKEMERIEKAYYEINDFSSINEIYSKLIKNMHATSNFELAFQFTKRLLEISKFYKIDLKEMQTYAECLEKYFQANTAFQNQDFSTAGTNYYEIFELYPQYFDPKQMLLTAANQFLEKKDFEKSIFLYERALKELKLTPEEIKNIQDTYFGIVKQIKSQGINSGELNQFISGLDNMFAEWETSDVKLENTTFKKMLGNTPQNQSGFIICPTCETQLRKTAKFCDNCGQKL